MCPTFSRPLIEDQSTANYFVDVCWALFYIFKHHGRIPNRPDFLSPNIILLNLAEKTTFDLPFEADSDTKRQPAIGFARTIARHALAAFLALTIFYLSLILTSAPVSEEDARIIDRAIKVLEEKGFSREPFLLRHVATFRSTNNWLNDLAAEENSYAATNFPFEIITLYPDFYTKATDDTERAMILLHEAQHLFMGSETAAYARVWRERHRLGWTQLSHGETPTFVTVELQTREYAPELFSCSVRLWNDCTESLRASR